VPLVNQLCPDFIFDTLINYKSEKLALSELKGKFVIIDFWGTFCIPCINAIPKMEALQKKFGDNLQVLMVAIDGFQKANQFYETRQKISKPMFLPSAISRKFFKYFQIKELPSYVWIDDQGYIKAITDESQVTDQNVADFINRKNVQFRSKEKEVIIDSKKYLLTIASEMDSGNVIYSSSLTKHLKGVSPTYFHPSRGGWTKVNARNMPIRSLYQIAFGDSVNLVPLNRTVIESAHPEKIACPKGEDYQVWKLDNSYCYELTVPKEKKHEILKMMRDELKKLFGYNVFQEYRTQKCLVLTAEKNPPIFADKNDTPKRATNMMGITVKNHPFSMLVESIQYYNQNIIVLDETGISGNIDVVLQAQPNDIDSLNEALKKYGLKLGYADRQVQMLVIKDPQ
jgi:uncharacterized protein (TIGR03435 family)